jgi:nucleotide-binding universal stress UspA family protein
MQRILFPTDFTDHAERAQAYALALARRFGAEVELLTSVYLSPVPVGPYTYPLPADYLSSSRDAARKALEEVTAAFSEQGVRASFQLANQDPATAITERAREWGADLIVMGTVGRTGLRHLFMGSVAERTARLAPCPVLTAHAGSPEPGEFQSLLVMTDFSACADAALEWARSLAEQTGGRLTLAHSYAFPIAQWGDSSYVSDSMLESVRQGAEQALSSLAGSVKGCPIDTVTTFQLATRAALDIVEERNIDLIVLGTRGLSGLAHVTLGSTAERIIRLSDVPVVTVKVAD